MSPRILALVIPALVLFATAGPVNAATVSATGGGSQSRTGSLTFEAAPGEKNRVTFKLRKKTVLVKDAKARLRGRKDCKRVRRGEVVCKLRGGKPYAHTFQLGDRGDRATLAEARNRPSFHTTLVNGGPGNDILNADRIALGSTLNGEDGDDHLTAGNLGGTLSGGAGADRLVGSSQADILVPDAQGTAPGDDVIIGNGGRDTISYAGHPQPVTVDLSRAAPQGAAGENDRIEKITDAVVIGSAHDDTLTGNGSGNRLDGGDGSDTLSGLAGDDQVVPDAPAGDPDRDSVAGGEGNDTVTYEDHPKAVTVDLASTSPQGDGDSLAGIENAVGSKFDDTLLGDEQANKLNGVAGTDVMEGRGGRDDLNSGSLGSDDHPDEIAGGEGDDSVFATAGGTASGGPGNDSLGGRGTLRGDAGDDSFGSVDGARAECGEGHDKVWLPHGQDAPSLLLDCERIDLGYAQELSMRLPLERASDSIVARGIRCSAVEVEESGEPTPELCKNKIEVRLGEQLLASGNFDASDQSRSFDAELPYLAGAKESLGGEPKQMRVSIAALSFDVML